MESRIKVRNRCNILTKNTLSKLHAECTRFEVQRVIFGPIFMRIAVKSVSGPAKQYEVEPSMKVMLVAIDDLKQSRLFRNGLSMLSTKEVGSFNRASVKVGRAGPGFEERN
jgi:hypothetical protein